MRKYIISKLISENKVRVLGRNDGETDTLTLYWHGSGLEFNIQATNLMLLTESDYSIYEEWIGVWIDGALISRQIVPKGKAEIPIFIAGDASQTRHVQIIKEVQPIGTDKDRFLKIRGIKTDGSFVKIEEPAIRLEFIGDSITSGEGTVGNKKEMTWNPMVMSTSFAYPFLTTSKLVGECRIMSQGGWGIFCSWDGNLNNNIPENYDNICSVLSKESDCYNGGSKKYDFTSWKPDVILINLGTNDEGAFRTPPQYPDRDGDGLLDQKLNKDGTYNEDCVKRILEAEKAFLYKVRRLNPESHIIWLTGSFPGEGLNARYENCVKEYITESGDKNAEMVRLQPFTPETVGSREHPGPVWHSETAKFLADRLRKYARR